MCEPCQCIVVAKDFRKEKCVSSLILASTFAEETQSKITRGLWFCQNIAGTPLTRWYLHLLDIRLGVNHILSRHHGKSCEGNMQPRLSQSDGACVLQVSHAPRLVLNPPKCLLNDDVDPPVVGSDCAGVVIRRPNSQRRSNRAPSQAQPAPLLFPRKADGTSPSSPARDSSEDVDEAALGINNPQEEDRVVGLPVHVVPSSDRWPLETSLQ
ncbi:unnamed protein product [Boreogadus saida]